MKFRHFSMSLGACGLAAVLALTDLHAQSGSPSAPANKVEEPGDLKVTRFENRDELIASVTAAVTQLDEQIAALKAAPPSQKPNSARTEAMAELDLARTDLEGKLEALDNVSLETWPTVRDHVLAALSRTQAAQVKAQSASS